MARPRDGEQRQTSIGRVVLGGLMVVIGWGFAAVRALGLHIDPQHHQATLPL